MQKRLLNILFWSIISAAFIGPGTIATAAQAGNSFQFELLWALVFSTFACLVLQEAAARLSIVSNRSLAQAISDGFGDKKNGWMVYVLIIGAIVIGSAAYQTGNLLGAAEGILILHPISQKILILILGVSTGIVLFFPNIQIIARTLGFLVFLMGFAFITTALLMKPDYGQIISGSFIPKMPEGSALLILGLIGTTVVPYNLFLGSGITDKTQTIKEMRFGISVAIILGGLISMAVLIVGTRVIGEFSFQSLSQTLSSTIGPWAVWLFAFGLFAAGFSSSITAPLASAITARDLFSTKHPKKWASNSLYFKLTWGMVLLIGIGFGLAGFKPIPAIIAAQALNGLILPLISIFLWFAINNKVLMGKNSNHLGQNLAFGITVWVSLVLGFQNIVKAGFGFFKIGLPTTMGLFVGLAVFALIITLFVALRIKKRNNHAQ